jgi:hypothetical protein
MAPEELANAPARPVADDRATEAPGGGDAETALTTVPRQREDDHETTTDLNTLPVDRLELAPPA